VKWIEAGSQLLTLLIGTLVFFLLAALIDHWIMPLGWFGRWTLLIGYLAGCGWFLATRVVPIVIREVNPAYSARVIEEATPTLKNSLINFLFLKQDQAGVKQAVLDAMQHRAAADISTIEVDTAIDRTPLIRLGYVMCGVMAVVALYKIVSPKDPFQTVARVVAPWADLARPSRVVIHEVTPGHTSVYLGSQVEVTADVQGVRGNDEVRLIYSTADGQVVDRAIVMKAAEGGRRYSATLPAADDSTEASSSRRPTGLQQGVQYHIEAGDALSSIYEIRVRMAPTIAVEKADLNFAPYTRRPMQTQETGEISALEGTRVTIHARANQPIKSAFLEFDPRPGSAAETLPLTVDGQDATGTFVLQLKPDRATPWRESYQVRFINDQGEVSEQPVIHKLQVQADLPPEVQILAPVQSRVDVAEDGQLTIEVRGVDPDFALTRLLVTGKTKDKPQFEQSLLPPGDAPSQATGKYEFRPNQLGLKAGTVVLVHGAAVDNRHDPVTGQLQPGRAQTSELTINIVPARKADGQNGAAGQQNQNQPNADPANGNQPMNAEQNKQPMNGQQPNGENKAGENQPGGENSPGNKSDQNKPEQKQDSGDQSQQKNDQPPQESQQGGSGSGQGSSGQSKEGEGSSSQPNKGQNSKPMEGQNGQGGSGQNQQPMPGQEQPNQNQAGNEGANNGSSQQQPGGGNSGMGTSQSADPMNQQTSEGQGGAPGSRNDQQPGANNTGSEQNEGGQGTGQAGGPQGRQGSGANQKPEHDGQKFEELLKHLREKSQQPKQGSEGQEVGSQQKNGGENSQPNGANQQPGNNSSKGGQPQPMNQQPGGQQPKEQPGAKGNDNRDVTAEELDQLAKQIGEKNGEPNANSAEKQPGVEQPGGQPAPMPGQNGQSGNQNGQAPQQGGKQPGSPQNGENQKKNDGQTGSPQGPPPQGEGDKPTPAEGEQKKPGAGQNGDSGAGSQSKDPTGSGQGQEQNRDVKKGMQSGNQQAESSDPSAPSTSRTQSDSKGGASGDQSGGGKQGAGQSGGQQGNDSAGGSSPGDEGAGAAKEQGKGETGTKGGAGQEAAGKTGVSGNKPGQGTETKAGSKGSEPGTDNPQGNQPKDKRGSQPGGSKAGGSDVGPGNPTGGGTAADRTGQGITNRSEDVADAANEAYTRKATDLVLQHLREQEHNPDPELAKRLQLTPQELQEFARRWNQLKKDAEADPSKARELDEAFRSLGLRDPKTKRRLGGTVSDKQRDLRDTGGRTQAPSKYRQQFDQFRKATGN
jgi:hypothetical protein